MATHIDVKNLFKVFIFFENVVFQGFLFILGFLFFLFRFITL